MRNKGECGNLRLEIGKTGFGPLVFLAAASFSLPLLSGCATVGGPQGQLPDNVRSVEIPVFTNRTGQPLIEDRLTDEVIRQFLSDGTLEVKNKGADVTLKGSLERYSVVPILYNASNLVEQYKMTLTLDLVFVENATGKELWRETGARTVEKFFTIYSATSTDVRTEEEAREDILREAAKKVLERVTRGWWIQEEF